MIKIVCPYCTEVFEITDRQAYTDPYFACEWCGDVIAGTTDIKNADGIPIGITMEEYLDSIEDEEEREYAESLAEEYRL